MSKKRCPSCHCVHWLETEECGHCYVHTKSFVEEKPREFWINCCIAFNNYEHLQTSIKTWHKQLKGAETIHVIDKSAYNKLQEELLRTREKNHLMKVALDFQAKKLSENEETISSLSKYSEHTFKIESHELEVTIRSRGIDVFAVKNIKAEK